MKKKIHFAYVYPFEFQALENYLNEMAQEGWFIQKMRGNYLIFEQNESERQIPHYSVGLIKHYHTGNPARESEEAQKYKMFMEDFDYHFVCGYGPFMIFKGTDSTPFHNDEQVTIEEVSNITKRYPKPLSELPILLGCIFILLIVSLLISFDFRIMFLSDDILWIGSIFLLITTACLFIVRKPYRAFKKNHELSNTSINSLSRLISSSLPLVLLMIFSVWSNTYFLLFMCALFLIGSSLQHIFYRYDTLILICQVLLLIVLANSDMSTPYPETTPKENIAEQLEIPYSSYALRSSPVLETETYKLGDWNIISHYVIKDTIMNNQIKAMIEGELKRNSSSLKAIRVSYSDIWVFYLNTDIDVTEKLDKVFPGQ